MGDHQSDSNKAIDRARRRAFVAEFFKIDWRLLVLIVVGMGLLAYVRQLAAPSGEYAGTVEGYTTGAFAPAAKMTVPAMEISVALTDGPTVNVPIPKSTPYRHHTRVELDVFIRKTPKGMRTYRFKRYVEDKPDGAALTPP